ncbi:MAG: ThuA domain-containing protein [Myxococcales bacterium]|nr:ThuA domain-containing protein [Myxococcota bacterium]MDW8280891.1 ThuA domain-containing protein [Myxococcales bacterium]
MLPHVDPIGPPRAAQSGVALVAALMLLAGCSSGGGGRDEDMAGGSGVRRLLVVTHTTGFRHSSIPTAEQTLGELAARSGLWTTYCRTAEEVRRLLTPEGLRDFDAVFFANTTGDLGVPELPALLRWVQQGGAFLGAHSAADTYHNQPAFLEMLGGQFRTHGEQTWVEVHVEDPTHPAVVHLAPRFRIFDEIYEFVDNPRRRAQILLSLDRHPDDGHPEAGMPGDFPLAWYRFYGQGRVFYTALGHREDVWQDERYRQHLLGALRWALAL